MSTSGSSLTTEQRFQLTAIMSYARQHTPANILRGTRLNDVEDNVREYIIRAARAGLTTDAIVRIGIGTLRESWND